MLTQATLDSLAPPDLSYPICHKEVPSAKPHYLQSLTSLLCGLCHAVPQLRTHFSLDLISNPSLKFKTATFSFSWTCGLSSIFACLHAKSLQSCPTLCDPVDHRPLGSSVHGTVQARILEWLVMPFSRGSSQLRDQTSVSLISCTG